MKSNVHIYTYLITLKKCYRKQFLNNQLLLLLCMFDDVIKTETAIAGSNN